MSVEFRSYTYQINTDTFGWKSYTRETLIAERVSYAIGLHRAHSAGIGHGLSLTVLLRRMLRDVMTDQERLLIQQEWHSWWDKHADCIVIGATLLEPHAALALPAAAMPVDGEINAAIETKLATLKVDA